MICMSSSNRECFRRPQQCTLSFHISSVFSFSVQHIMDAVQKVGTDTRGSGSEEEHDVPASQSSSATAMEIHDAAAKINAAKKAEERARSAAKRKADKVLTMPQTVNVSALQVSLDEAKKKRDTAKKEAKVEANKVKLARKRVERVKAKAKVLSNNDLYEVYLMRMQEAEKKKAQDKATSPKVEKKCGA